MVRNFCLAVAVVLGLAASASAQAFVQVAGDGALKLSISIDGVVEILNTSDAPLALAGYTVSCDTGCLNDANYHSIADRAAADPVGVIGKYGAGALSFGEAGVSSSAVAELNVAGAANLPAGDALSLGDLIDLTGSETLALVQQGAIKLSWLRGDNTAIDRGPAQVQVPEPSSIALAGLAVAGLVAVARRRS